jgi:ATP-binding cassette, subfamily F, member 3
MYFAVIFNTYHSLLLFKRVVARLLYQMLAATNIYIQYGDRILLNNVNVVIGDRDKVGLVGRNGAGKSTLMKILASYDNPQQGQVTKPSAATVGFLHQDMMLPKGKTVLEETLTAFEELKKMEEELQRVEQEVAERTDYESDSYMDLLELLANLSDRFSYMDGDTMQAQAEKILGGLGFKTSDMNRLTDEFSGGWQMRIELAKMLLQKPDYILLDEPTNHLDIESIIWLENFLKDYAGAVIVISHDKEFLNNVTTRTVEVELGKLHDYKANYSKFVEMRKERRELMQNAFNNQQRIIADKERTIERFKAKANKASMAQSMMKQLDKIERVELEEEDITAMKIRFPEPPRSGQVPVEGIKIKKSYGDLHVLNGVDFKMDRGDRVAFVGQNGQGKTTLAKILVNAENCNDGTVVIGHNVSLGYYAQNQAESLDREATVYQTVEAISPPEMRTRLRNILGCFMFSGSDVDKKVSVLSGGERARLALACLLLRPINLLVLDEPTNHLDMISKDVLKQAVKDYDGALIVVSHDRDFLSDLTTKTYEFRDKQIYEYLGDVNYFLQKRQLDDMRSVELSTKQTAKADTNKAVTLDDNAKKVLQKRVQNAERNIQELEKKIVNFEKLMGEDGFYQRADADKQLANYNLLKKDLDAAMAEWEAATMEIEG